MHSSNRGSGEENADVFKDAKVNKDAKIYLQLESDELKDDAEAQIDLLNIAGHMSKKKGLYGYLLAIAGCVGILLGLVVTGVNYMTGENSYARAVVSFQYDGIENGVDPDGAAFDINKIKSPRVIEDALMALGVTEYEAEEIREHIEIEGVVPEDAVERITVIKQMSLEEISNYEKILDVSYFPSQYIVYLHRIPRLSGAKSVQILNAVLESYRTYFMDTYANTEVLAVTGRLIDYKDYDYTEAMDMIESQMEIMQNYVNERKNQAPEFRSSGTGLSFGDISMALQTVSEINIANLNSYIESHMLTKDMERQREYFEYKIKKYNMDIAQCQVELSNIQSVIDKYQKDPVVIVSAQETTQQFEQTNEYYDQLLQQRLNISAKIASLNTKLNETYGLLNAVNNASRSNTQDEYKYADEKLTLLTDTITQWAGLTEQTAEEYYATTLFTNAYKIGVPAQYTAAGGIVSVAKNLLFSLAAVWFIVFAVWCADGVVCELRRMRKDKRET